MQVSELHKNLSQKQSPTKCQSKQTLSIFVLSQIMFSFFVFFQTYIGSILVSVNPYKMYNIYGTDVVLLYKGCALGENPP